MTVFWNILFTPLHIINANTANTGIVKQQDIRFGLTSALLHNGYFSYDYGDKDHGQLWWYDEYGIDLGQPVTDELFIQNSDVSSPAVIQREFEHGLAIVNSTKQEQTVILDGEYEKIKGIHDPIVNNGAIISETIIGAEDGLVLLKTFATLEDVVFTNGHFARLLRPDGTRVRNGFFVFEQAYDGGDQIAHIDVNNNGKKDLLVASQNKITVWRDDGQLYMRLFPYTTSYQGDLSIALGDITGDGELEIIVAPKGTYPLPIKVYSRHGVKVREEWYPFGKEYRGGYTVAVGNVLGKSPQEIIVGSGQGNASQIAIINDEGEIKATWPVFESSFRGGISVAAGNVDGQGYDEIVVGAGKGKQPFIRVYDSVGKQLYDQFLAYSALGTSGIDVQVVDVNFDGQEDIIGLSDGI